MLNLFQHPTRYASALASVLILDTNYLILKRAFPCGPGSTFIRLQALRAACTKALEGAGIHCHP